MNVLRSHVLHEVTQLDMKSLVVIQSIMAALKRPITPIVPRKRGVAAAHCRKVLDNLKENLGQTIMEEREERL